MEVVNMVVNGKRIGAVALLLILVLAGSAFADDTLMDQFSWGMERTVADELLDSPAQCGGGEKSVTYCAQYFWAGEEWDLRLGYVTGSERLLSVEIELPYTKKRHENAIERLKGKGWIVVSQRDHENNEIDAVALSTKAKRKDFAAMMDSFAARGMNGGKLTQILIPGAALNLALGSAPHNMGEMAKNLPGNTTFIKREIVKGSAGNAGYISLFFYQPLRTGK